MSQKKQPVKRSGTKKRSAVPLTAGNGLLYAAGAVAVVAALFLQAAMPNGFPLTHKETKDSTAITEIHSSGVRLNEIMTSNSASLTDENRKTSDWIEIANAGKSTKDISGYKLAKKAKADTEFVFPKGTRINPDECLIVFADSTNGSDSSEEFHAPFSLSADGDTLLLFNDADIAIDTVNIPAMAADQAYIRQNTNAWGITTQCTPGMMNTMENYNSLLNAESDGSLQISEILASNDKYAMTKNGAYYDYIVIRNNTGNEIDLDGYYISDNPELTRKWRVPEGVIVPAGGNVLIYCSGLDSADASGELHTNFRLRSEGEKVILSNSIGQPIDIASYDLLKTNVALIRGADGTWAQGTPTK